MYNTYYNESMKRYKINDREYNCPLQLALSTVMGKWKGLVIWFLLETKIVRYSELKKKITEVTAISDKMLIQALRELEHDGLIEREIYKVVPPKVEYKLTKDGSRLKPVVDALEKFGMTYEIKK